MKILLKILPYIAIVGVVYLGMMYFKDGGSSGTDHAHGPDGAHLDGSPAHHDDATPHANEATHPHNAGGQAATATTVTPAALAQEHDTHPHKHGHDDHSHEPQESK